MLKKHCLSMNWKHFGEDLRNLDIEENNEVCINSSKGELQNITGP